ncbi:PREDICTED: rabankyrin-5 [Bactrocera latifrons]|uniref:Ankyrin repeat and FYVE domain-containing protein 1 n=2 Tax=Bactrocera latifrons TaxID=174628 RepID=A0A0K8VC97_BACLA|nr:PREDICTED: rabankyrin-5 [Bactrocera latifrons]
MSNEDKRIITKLEKNISLLKEEYTKLQQEYAQLERKYNEVALKLEDDTIISGFVSRLVMTVASLYKKNVYSDICIRIGDVDIPAHKFVLQSRSDEWSQEFLNTKNELVWSNFEEDIGIALLRWIYTDIADLENDRIALGLLRAAHCFKLPGLMGLCERALVVSANIRSCVKFYCVAEEVGAMTLLEYCSSLISSHWDDLASQDFEHMSGALLYKMLKSKTKYPLHTAVRLLREDVVFLCLVENDNKLSEICNSISDQGQLPLQLALTAKHLSIAETLVKNGFADINAYDAEGLTLLIRSVKDIDEFAANFLLDHGCQLDLSARESGNTALHMLCQYNSGESERDDYSSIINISEKLLSLNPNVNVQNNRGETPLHVAILSGNHKIINMMVSRPDIDINLQNHNDNTALELCLLNKVDLWKLPLKLIELGANVNPIKTSTQDDLMQVLAKRSLEDSAIFLADYADLNHVNAEGYTVLHIAAHMNLSNLAAKLLQVGANSNAQLRKSQMKSPIHIAVEANATDVLKEILNQKSSVSGEPPNFDCKDNNGNTPLSLSIELGRRHLVSILIDGGANVNARNDNDMTLLHQSILNKDEDTAILLLRNGADANFLTGDKKSPLQLAIYSHLPKVVDNLCAKGVALKTFNDNMRDPPLWTSLELGYEDIAQILLRHGVDTDCWDIGPEGCMQTMLHRAIDENKESIAIFLIKSQCDIDSPRQPGPKGEGGDEANDKASPLHVCCHWGLIKVLQALIDHGANVNALDINNQTPIHIAIRNQHEEIISILLCHPNIDLRIRDHEGNTPFAQALLVRNHKAAERILERLPNAAEQMDNRGRNFLHLAILKDDLESVLFLLSVQVDVNSRVHDVNQSTPLHLAASSRNEMIMRTLILAGARVSETDATQKTPLHISADQGNLAAVSALLQNNADYDSVDSDGNNALHIAVRRGYLSIVRELLTESQIDAEAVNQKGRTPLHELCRTGEDTSAAAICDLFIECMPKYPINKPDADGNTPLLLAFMRGQSPLCKTLVKYGACLGMENRDGVSIFNFKLATDQLLHKLLDQLPQESPWSESDVCQECRIKFSLTVRKHHCRHCGRVLCSKCSNNDVPILKFGLNKPTRVCCTCFNVLQGGKPTLQ